MPRRLPPSAVRALFRNAEASNSGVRRQRVGSKSRWSSKARQWPGRNNAVAIAIPSKSSRGRRSGSRSIPAVLSQILSEGFNEDEITEAQSQIDGFQIIREDDPSHVPMSSFRGNPEVLAKLEEIVELLRNPENYTRVGAKPPKGVLFCGETGTGKTFAARAIASAAGVPFHALIGSDFRQSPYSGVGASLASRIFERARKHAPCIIFIDEIDSLGEARKHGSIGNLDVEQEGGSAKVDQETTLNALLAKMDGFAPTSGVLFLAATNRPEVLDEALVRAGRFDYRIDFRLPDQTGRESILRGYADGLSFAAGHTVDFAELAQLTPAFSPADLQALLNKAALFAAREKRPGIVVEDVEASVREAKLRKSKARPEGSFQVVETVSTNFKDVKGHDEAISEFSDLVDVLKHREKYCRIGAVPPRGLLIDGPPGVGKTHCARALAGEVGLPFLSVAGSDFQSSRYAGHGTKLVKRLFALARKLQPCVVFIDELDAVGRRREASARGAEQDRENTMLQLLVELDGFEERSDVLVVAATNRVDVLDPALLRPGRFDRRVSLDLPDTAGRRGLAELYTSQKPLAGDVDLGEVARRTAGFSGAEIRTLVNEAALLAAKNGAEEVSCECLNKAADRISLGIAKANPARSHEARRLTACHEAGHVILGFAFSTMTHRRVARASIRPRMGGIGGVTVFEPLDEDADGVLPFGLFTRQGCNASLCVDLGGRVAEEVMFQPLEVSSGATADFRSATRRAMAMVSDWGLGGSVLSLDAMGQCSDATLREKEVAASSVLAQALASSRAILSSGPGRRSLERVTSCLLEAEEAGADELCTLTDVVELQRMALEQTESWITDKRD